MSASGCTIQMSVQLVEHIAQTLYALLVGLNQYGLEVDRQAVPGEMTMIKLRLHKQN